MILILRVISLLLILMLFLVLFIGISSEQSVALKWKIADNEKIVYEYIYQYSEKSIDTSFWVLTPYAKNKNLIRIQEFVLDEKPDFIPKAVVEWFTKSFPESTRSAVFTGRLNPADYTNFCKAIRAAAYLDNSLDDILKSLQTKHSDFMKDVNHTDMKQMIAAWRKHKDFPFSINQIGLLSKSGAYQNMLSFIHQPHLFSFPQKELTAPQTWTTDKKTKYLYDKHLKIDTIEDKSVIKLTAIKEDEEKLKIAVLELDKQLNLSGWAYKKNEYLGIYTERIQRSAIGHFLIDKGRLMDYTEIFEKYEISPSEKYHDVNQHFLHKFSLRLLPSNEIPIDIQNWN